MYFNNECIPLATGLRVEAKPLTCWVSLNKQTSLKSGEDPTESNMSFMSSASSHYQTKQVSVHYYHTFFLVISQGLVYVTLSNYTPLHGIVLTI